MTSRVSTLTGHLTLSPTSSTVLGRTTTALEPSLLDSDRRALPCRSIQEREAWLRYFTSVRPKEDEGEYEIDGIQGVIPDYVKGTFVRNGPGLFERNGMRVHMADGDGLMVKISFPGEEGGRIRVKERYLRTPEFMRESEVDRVLYRGSYGTSVVQGKTLRERFTRNVGNLEWKVTGNTNHLFWGGKLYALHEIGLPIELNPKTLDVVDPKSTLNGMLASNDVFSAHHRFDRDRGTVLNFGINYREAKRGCPKMTFWEFDESFKVISKSTLQLTFSTIVHSFAATERYFIQLMAPCKGGILYFLGWGVDDSIQHDVAADCAWICIVDRFAVDKNDATWYKCVNWWPNHHIGAYETPEGDIVLDSVMYERKTVQWIEREPFDLPKTRVVRFRIPHGKNAAVKNKSKNTTLFAPHEVVFNGDCEMPIYNPTTELKQRRYVWLVDLASSKMPNKHADQIGLSHKFGEALTETPWTGVIKLDLQTKAVQMCSPQTFCGEVVFVPDNKPGAKEDEGVLLCLLFDPVLFSSCLAVLDAADITKGPIAKIPLKSPVPFSFHCGFEKNLPF